MFLPQGLAFWNLDLKISWGPSTRRINKPHWKVPKAAWLYVKSVVSMTHYDRGGTRQSGNLCLWWYTRWTDFGSCVQSQGTCHKRCMCIHICYCTCPSYSFIYRYPQCAPWQISIQIRSSTRCYRFSTIAHLGDCTNWAMPQRRSTCRWCISGYGICDDSDFHVTLCCKTWSLCPFVGFTKTSRWERERWHKVRFGYLV